MKMFWNSQLRAEKNIFSLLGGVSMDVDTVNSERKKKIFA